MTNRDAPLVTAIQDDDNGDHIFALSGGKRGSSVRTFRDANRAVHALIRQYRLHSNDQGWSFAFVWLKAGEITPVSLTSNVRAVFESQEEVL